MLTGGIFSHNEYFQFYIEINFECRTISPSTSQMGSFKSLFEAKSPNYLNKKAVQKVCEVKLFLFYPSHSLTRYKVKPPPRPYALLLLIF